MSLAYSDAPFYWPLRGSIALQNGSGAPTFTRATAKWMFNDEGKLIKLPSGAIEMRGYRPVINYFSYSEDLVNAVWTKTGISATAAAYVTEDSGLSSHGIQRTVTTPIAINDFVAAKLKVRSDRRYVLLRINDSASNANAASIVFDLQNGSIVTSATAYGSFMTAAGSISAIDSNGYYTISLSVKTSVASVNFKAQHSASSTLTGDGQLSTFTGDGSSRLYCTELQFEITTGADDKTSSNEYVSVNVLSSPWHGAGADGVKFFATTKAGTAIPETSLIGAGLNPNSTTNNLLYCRDLLAGALVGKWIPSTIGSNLVTNGSFDTDASGWSTFNCTPSVSSGQCTLTASGDNPYMSRSMTTVIGKLYVVSCDVVSDSMSGNNFMKVGSSVGSGNIGGLVTVVGTNKFSFIATGTTTYITVSGVAGVSGQTIVVDNITCYESAVLIALNQTGIDNQPNSSSLLTATTDNATISQTITAAAAAGCSGYFVRRATGTGNVYFTRDGGTNWLDITSLINGSTPTLVKIENTSVTNPQVGFKIATSGDQIHVDAGLNHLGTELANPILTTSAAVTVNADVLTAPTSGNFSDSAGTILATVTRDTWATSNGSVVGSATRGLYTSAANSGVQGLDGTNTVNGPSGEPITQRKLGIRYSGVSLQAFAGNNFGSAGNYDGNFNLTNIGIATGIRGGIKDIAIWQSSLTDSQITEVNSNTVNLVSSTTINYSNTDSYTITRDLVSIPNITSNIYNCQFRLGSLSILSSINYNNINSIIYAGNLNITPSINNYFNNCQYRLANADSSINTSYNLINCIINTGRLDSISNIDSSIYNCQYRLSNANIIATTTTNVLNNYKINTGFLITSNIVSSLVNKNIIYSIKLDAEYSVPVIQVNYLIN